MLACSADRATFLDYPDIAIVLPAFVENRWGRPLVRVRSAIYSEDQRGEQMFIPDGSGSGGNLRCRQVSGGNAALVVDECPDGERAFAPTPLRPVDSGHPGSLA
jgi:hypothetical protein